MANPQKAKKSTAAPTQASSARSWKKRVGGIPVTLPSGEVALVKRPGMDKIMSSGIMPDSLTPIAMKHLDNAESGGRPQNDEALNKELMAKVMQDPAQLQEIFLAFDKILVMCVVEPKCRLHLFTPQDALEGLCEEDRVGEEIPDDERDDEIVYSDEVDQEDKIFIFNYVVGGSKDLERFRQESSAAVAHMDAG